MPYERDQAMVGASHQRRDLVVMPDDLQRDADEPFGRRHSVSIRDAIEEKQRRHRLAESFQRVVGSVEDGEIPQ